MQEPWCAPVDRCRYGARTVGAFGRPVVLDGTQCSWAPQKWRLRRDFVANWANDSRNDWTSEECGTARSRHAPQRDLCHGRRLPTDGNRLRRPPGAGANRQPQGFLRGSAHYRDPRETAQRLGADLGLSGDVARRMGAGRRGPGVPGAAEGDRPVARRPRISLGLQRPTPQPPFSPLARHLRRARCRAQVRVDVAPPVGDCRIAARAQRPVHGAEFMAVVDLHAGSGAPHPWSAAGVRALRGSARPARTMSGAGGRRAGHRLGAGVCRGGTPDSRIPGTVLAAPRISGHGPVGRGARELFRKGRPCDVGCRQRRVPRFGRFGRRLRMPGRTAFAGLASAQAAREPEIL